MSVPVYRRIPPDKPASVEELARLYAPMARHWAFNAYMRSGNSLCHLEDLEQDAWVGIMRAWHRWAPGRGTTFRTYANNWARWSVLNGRQHTAGLAYGVARNGRVVVDEPLQVEALEDPVVESTYQERLAWDSFLQLVSMAPTHRERSILMQHYGQGHPLKDIGRRMGVSSERVRQILVRSYEEIKKRIEL